jgi:hypothetical protein
VALTCARCGGEVDVRADWTLAEVTGWQRQRKGGGLNHLLFPERTGKLMCAPCALRLRYTGDQLRIDA